MGARRARPRGTRQRTAPRRRGPNLPRAQSAVMAALPVAGVVLAALFSPVQAQTPACPDAADIAVLPSPVAPWKGAPLRVIFTTEKPLDGELALVAPNGSVAAKSRDRQGGPPYFWYAEVTTPAAGTWRARLT